MGPGEAPEAPISRTARGGAASDHHLRPDGSSFRSPGRSPVSGISSQNRTNPVAPMQARPRNATLLPRRSLINPASVVLSDEFRTETRRTVRVVIRQDFATGELLDQVIPGKGADSNDPAVAAEAARRLARLRSEVGL